MKHYTANSNSSTEQTIVQAGQTQQQVQGQPLLVQVSGGWLVTSTGQLSWSKLFLVDKVKPLCRYLCLGHGVCSRYSWSHQDRSRSRVGRLCKCSARPSRSSSSSPTAIIAGQTQTQQQIALQGQQVAQTAEGQTIVYQPVNADGTILQQGMITIPTASLAGAQTVLMEGDTNTTSNGQGTVIVTFPVAGNVVNSGGMVMMVPGAGSVPTIQRIPLPGPNMLEEEPLYISAKQYHLIFKRRQARTKLEAEGKIPKERRKYLHESQHHHAIVWKCGEGR